MDDGTHRRGDSDDRVFDLFPAGVGIDVSAEDRVPVPERHPSDANQARVGRDRGADVAVSAAQYPDQHRIRARHLDAAGDHRGAESRALGCAGRRAQFRPLHRRVRDRCAHRNGHAGNIRWDAAHVPRMWWLPHARPPQGEPRRSSGPGAPDAAQYGRGADVAALLGMGLGYCRRDHGGAAHRDDPGDLLA